MVREDLGGIAMQAPLPGTEVAGKQLSHTRTPAEKLGEAVTAVCGVGAALSSFRRRAIGLERVRAEALVLAVRVAFRCCSVGVGMQSMGSSKS